MLYNIMLNNKIKKEEIENETWYAQCLWTTEHSLNIRNEEKTMFWKTNLILPLSYQNKDFPFNMLLNN